MTITLTREEAQQVLDALEAYPQGWRTDKAQNAIKILRARLEQSEVAREGPVREWARISQAEPEPVAWTTDVEFDDDTEIIPSKIKGKLGTAEMDIPLYTTPPQREWQGLTDEEYEAMAEQYVTNYYFDTLKYARAVEAKLKEKNT